MTNKIRVNVPKENVERKKPTNASQSVTFSTFSPICFHGNKSPVISVNMVLGRCKDTVWTDVVVEFVDGEKVIFTFFDN